MKALGVYHDADAADDTVDTPADRGSAERCVNCGYTWGHHAGWHCKSGIRANFHHAPPGDRYLTAAMGGLTPAAYTAPGYLGRIVTTIKVGAPWNKPAPKPDRDETHWKAWAHNAPGDCPCGIAEAMCTYHAKDRF